MGKSLKDIYKKFSQKLNLSLQSEKGQSLTEYGLLLVLIAVVVILMLKGTGQEVNEMWSKINSGMNQ